MPRPRYVLALFAVTAVTLPGCSNPDAEVGVPSTQSVWESAATATVSPYPDGILPVGDGLYDSKDARFGHVFTCPGFADSLGNNGIGGAVERGPWFTADGKGWNPALKPTVRGDVPVPGEFRMQMRDHRRVIETNGLPLHHIGEFPVSPDDPAYAIDPNPNTPAARSRVYDLPAKATSAILPGCVGHQVGVLTNGAALFSPLDAQGRDAVAWEVQDRCDGHPEPDGTYHYHGPSPCLPGMDTPDVVGFALDGFPITGNLTRDGRTLWSRDLDTCHGQVSEIELDGQTVSSYHYVLTKDWPYTVACFAGGDVDQPPPPAPHEHDPGKTSHGHDDNTPRRAGTLSPEHG